MVLETGVLQTSRQTMWGLVRDCSSSTHLLSELVARQMQLIEPTETNDMSCTD